MNEERFVEKLTAMFPQGKEVVVGPGDDCAVLDLGTPDLLLAAVDQVITDVHYLRNTPPGKIAAKLINRNISDIASMGGLPTHVLLALAVNPMSEEWLLCFHESIAKIAGQYGISVIGGDMAKLFTHGESLSLSILGKVERNKLCLRSNAKAGDGFYVTGVFGNSFASEHHLNFIPRVKEARFLAGTYTKTMQDVSDGLLKDAGRIARASGLALQLEPEKIPLRAGATQLGALTDGEDYELLFSMPDSLAEKLAAEWPFTGTPVSRIGTFMNGTPGSVSGIEPIIKTGYDHFQ